MDIWTKIFLYLGAVIAAMALMAIVMILGNAQDGQLTVEGLQHQSEALTSFYGLMKILVYIWLPFLFIWLYRLIRG